jgi:hypothetical protein
MPNDTTYPQDRLQLHQDGTAFQPSFMGFGSGDDAGLIIKSDSLSATDATRVTLIATRAMQLTSVKISFTTASSSGTVTVEKLTGTTAPGSGTVLLTTPLLLSGTANTVQSGVLIATLASLQLAAGDRFGIVIAGTMTNLVGGMISTEFAPI